jgi:hypothetical protein
MGEHTISLRDRAVALILALGARSDDDVDLAWILAEALVDGDIGDLVTAIRRARRDGLAIDRRALCRACAVADLNSLRRRWPRVAEALDEPLLRPSTTTIVPAPTVTWHTRHRGAA